VTGADPEIGENRTFAIIEELPPADGADSGTEPWFRVELRAQSLDWVPPALASLDRPFLVERPDELRDLIIALADRLAAAARGKPFDSDSDRR
jgi:hypothetical protein